MYVLDFGIQNNTGAIHKLNIDRKSKMHYQGLDVKSKILEFIM